MRQVRGCVILTMHFVPKINLVYCTRFNSFGHGGGGLSDERIRSKACIAYPIIEQKSQKSVKSVSHLHLPKGIFLPSPL
jgi:hypothetical protein